MKRSASECSQCVIGLRRPQQCGTDACFVPEGRNAAFCPKQVAEQNAPGSADADVDMQNLDTTSFDMSALMDACRELSTNREVEEKVKKSNLFMRHILTAYDEVLEEKNEDEKELSERFLKRLKKPKKKENSARQNRRQSQSKSKGENYNERYNQKVMKKKRNMKARGRMDIY